MMLGREDSPLVAGALRAAEIHGLPYEILDGGAVSFRFPAFSLDPDEVGVYEEKAGYLRAETAWQAFLTQSQQRGAAVRLAQSVSGWDLTARGVQIRLGDGASIEAERVIVSAGPWTGRFWPYPLTVERQVVFWFESPALNAMAHYPVFMRQDVLGRIAYGFPYLVGEGLKAARHHGGASGAVPEVDRRVHASDEEQVRELMQFIPACASAPVRQAVVCLYTNTPDEHFVMGPVAGTEGRVVMAGGFSGHGFKFASILGELLVKQTESAALLSDLALFDPGRFRGGGSPPDSAI